MVNVKMTQICFQEGVMYPINNTIGIFTFLNNTTQKEETLSKWESEQKNQ